MKACCQVLGSSLASSAALRLLEKDSAGSLRIHEDYGREDVAKVNVLEGCFIELSKVFAE